MNSKSKGKRGELEWARFCRERGFECRRSQQFCGADGDADVIGIDGLHMEVKRVEKLNLEAAFDQSKNDSRDGETPIVAHRKNRGEWLVTLRADDFLKIWGELEEKQNE